MTDKKIRPFGKKDELGYVFGDMAGASSTYLSMLTS